jgi:hypothetical protein
MAKYRRAQGPTPKGQRPLTLEQHAHLLVGASLDAAGFSPAGARAAWVAHRAAMMGARGALPWGWWRYEAQVDAPEYPDPRTAEGAEWDGDCERIDRARCLAVGVPYPRATS